MVDEIYQMKSYDRGDKHVILSLDASNADRPKTKVKVKVKDKDGKEVKGPDGNAVEEEQELGFFERGKRDDQDYAVSWTREFGKGRVFYTSLGHREEVWDLGMEGWWRQAHQWSQVAQAYQAHLLGGIRWALGLAGGSATGSGDASSGKAK